MASADQLARSPWPHRLAVVLACATFPLVWVGGLVTTTDAGMAVPDWPNTYGYNLFLYPWQTWLYGPWDLFIEHGHRLLASSVGLLTIILLVVLLKTESRRWMKGLGFVALWLVLTQGILGGMRVLFDERTLAMLHGCTGPLFFAVTVAMAVFTSNRWHAGADSAELASKLGSAASNIRLLAIGTAVLAYLQIVLGAVLRHVPVDAQPGTFMLAVKAHLIMAIVLTIHIIVLSALVLLYARRPKPLGRLAATLLALVVIQIGLGAGTWIVKYSVPAWAADWIGSLRIAVQEGGAMQTHTITSHVAVGSLILGTSVALALYAGRLLANPASIQQVVRGRLEAAV
jgi:cytochrome c oxidase assembly protein subunit 15